jgi:iron complex transport system substrate-binding protein
MVAGAAAVLALAACGHENDDRTESGTATGKATDSFPITIENAYGKTVIEEEPKRVATWGWGSTEAAIAAGVYPVAVAEQIWTVGKGNLLPWVEQAYDKAGVAHPALLADDGSGATVPYDEFIAAKPDLILAPYSGLTEEQYDTLSKIAPVVAFPDGPWTTPWDQTIEITAKALGRSAAGDRILSDIDDYFAAERAKHPEFEGKTLAGIWAEPNKLSLYTARDPRVGILTKLGFEIAPSVDALDTSDGGFFYEMSYEKADRIDADVVITYHETPESAAATLKDRKALAIPALARGAVAQMVGRENVSSVSPPTALSFAWEDGLPALVDKLAAAVEAAG